MEGLPSSSLVDRVCCDFGKDEDVDWPEVAVVDNPAEDKEPIWPRMEKVML